MGSGITLFHIMQHSRTFLRAPNTCCCVTLQGNDCIFAAGETLFYCMWQEWQHLVDEAPRPGPAISICYMSAWDSSFDRAYLHSIIESGL